VTFSNCFYATPGIKILSLIRGRCCTSCLNGRNSSGINSGFFKKYIHTENISLSDAFLRSIFGEILSGTRELRHDKSASGVRFLNFCNWLVETISAHNIYTTFFERVYAQGVEAAHVYGAFMYILAMVCERSSNPGLKFKQI
jgi:hypothetical protein